MKTTFLLLACLILGTSSYAQDPCVKDPGSNVDHIVPNTGILPNMYALQMRLAQDNLGINPEGVRQAEAIRAFVDTITYEAYLKLVNEQTGTYRIFPNATTCGIDLDGVGQPIYFLNNIQGPTVDFYLSMKNAVTAGKESTYYKEGLLGYQMPKCSAHLMVSGHSVMDITLEDGFIGNIDFFSAGEIYTIEVAVYAADKAYGQGLEISANVISQTPSFPHEVTESEEPLDPHSKGLFLNVDSNFDYSKQYAFNTQEPSPQLPPLNIPFTVELDNYVCIWAQPHKVVTNASVNNLHVGQLGYFELVFKAQEKEQFRMKYVYEDSGFYGESFTHEGNNVSLTSKYQRTEQGNIEIEANIGYGDLTQ